MDVNEPQRATDLPSGPENLTRTRRIRPIALPTATRTGFLRDRRGEAQLYCTVSLDKSTVDARPVMRPLSICTTKNMELS